MLMLTVTAMQVGRVIATAMQTLLLLLLTQQRSGRPSPFRRSSGRSACAGRGLQPEGGVKMQAIARRLLLQLLVVAVQPARGARAQATAGRMHLLLVAAAAAGTVGGAAGVMAAAMTVGRIGSMQHIQISTTAIATATTSSSGSSTDRQC
jgi:hypothetical protein